MAHDKDQPEWLDNADAVLDSDPAEVYAPRVSPGKRTLTMGLPGRRSTAPTAPTTPTALSTATGPIQRKMKSGGAGYEKALFGPFDNLAPPAQSPAVGPDGGRAPAPVQRALKNSTGSPLPKQVKGALERSYGADLSDVRVHTGAASADAANSIQAKAFTHGRNIHMAAGTYAPDSPEGFSLIAHEAAHTVQAAAAAVQAKLEVASSDSAAEREADQAASAAMRGERFAISSAGGAVARMIHRADQREGTAIPDAATQSAINSELYPASVGGGGAPAPWDGAAGQPNEAANRAALITEMHAAMDAHLAAAMPGINAVAGRRRVPIAQLEGAGQAAKADADRHFGQWATAAALTVPQETARASYSISASGADQNLFDAQDTGDRATVGMAIDPADLASWIAETEPGCVTARNTHHLVPSRSATERTFLRNDILAPWVAANDADLRLYDQHGFALSNPETGQIVLPTSVPGGLSDTAPGGGPSDAERGRKWRAWRTMVHEYIHQLEHPALHSWPGRNRAISEGFCELFTKEVLLPLLPTTAGADVGRRTLVEGGDFGAPSAAIIGGPYSAGSYAGYLARVEAIQGHLGGASVGARNAMKAIFFQGHIEYLGYDTAGNPLTAPAGPQDQINVPAGLVTFADLATAINVPEPDLRVANPGVPEPLPGRRVRAPGCREHRVVVSSDGASTRAETRRVIATQHDVTEAALAAANPGVDFTTLTGGEIIIIPAH